MNIEIQNIDIWFVIPVVSFFINYIGMYLMSNTTIVVLNISYIPI